MQKKFIKLNKQETQEIYGGWAWVGIAVPLFLEAAIGMVATIKMLNSSSGKVKYKDLNAEWKESSHSKISSRVSKPKPSKIYYYGY